MCLRKWCKINAEGVATVDRLIMATSHGDAPTAPSEQLLIDIDLSILGSEPSRFQEFEDQIRAEYWWVPGPIYKKKRLQLLKLFSARKNVFCTNEFQARYEDKARTNLATAIGALER